jgi:hypothetical protein
MKSSQICSKCFDEDYVFPLLIEIRKFHEFRQMFFPCSELIFHTISNCCLVQNFNGSALGG